jgi:hypothetical protein
MRQPLFAAPAGPISIDAVLLGNAAAALATVRFSMVGATSRTIAFPLFTNSSRRRLFIDQLFFEQI